MLKNKIEKQNSINKGKNKNQTQTNLLNLVKIFKTRNP